MVVGSSFSRSHNLTILTMLTIPKILVLSLTHFSGSSGPECREDSLHVRGPRGQSQGGRVGTVGAPVVPSPALPAAPADAAATGGLRGGNATPDPATARAGAG